MPELAERFVLKDPSETQTAIDALGVIGSERGQYRLEFALTGRMVTEMLDPYQMSYNPELVIRDEGASIMIGDIIMGLEMIIALKETPHDKKMAALALRDSMFEQRYIR